MCKAQCIMLLLATLHLNVLAKDQVQQINQVLDSFHQAAAQANGQQYFDLLSEQAVFIGTDATERWPKTDFTAFAQPYFAAGKGWLYTPRNRYVSLSKNGQVAWFDEMLDNQSYGECRGTGVLELTDSGWKISQYHLTIPVPNALAKSFVQQIKQHQQN